MNGDSSLTFIYFSAIDTLRLQKEYNVSDFFAFFEKWADEHLSNYETAIVEELPHPIYITNKNYEGKTDFKCTLNSVIGWVLNCESDILIAKLTFPCIITQSLKNLNWTKRNG